jgi:mRNA interferase MazF
VAYVPDRGDVVWLTLTPQAGHEQAGRRPAIVLSPKRYNGVGLAGVPGDEPLEGLPFEVALPSGLRVAGVALSDHQESRLRAREAVLAARPRRRRRRNFEKATTLLQP